MVPGGGVRCEFKIETHSDYTPNRSVRLTMPNAALQRKAERDIHARINRIAQVIHAVNIDDINVLRV